MPLDTYKNFAYSMVVAPPTPPNVGTSLTVPSGHSARFPPPPFSVSIWPFGLAADPTNAEIVRVTAVAGNVWTIQRGREGSANRTIEVNDQIAQAMTAQTLVDLKADWQAALAALNLDLQTAIATAQTTITQALGALGQWVSVPYNAANYSTGWNVSAAHQLHWSAVAIGKLTIVNLRVENSSVTNVGTSVSVVLPITGVTAPATGSMVYTVGGSGWRLGIAECYSGNNKLFFAQPEWVAIPNGSFSVHATAVVQVV